MSKREKRTQEPQRYPRNKLGTGDGSLVSSLENASGGEVFNIDMGRVYLGFVTKPSRTAHFPRTPYGFANRWRTGAGILYIEPVPRVLENFRWRELPKRFRVKSLKDFVVTNKLNKTKKVAIPVSGRGKQNDHDCARTYVYDMCLSVCCSHSTVVSTHQHPVQPVSVAKFHPTVDRQTTKKKLGL